MNFALGKFGKVNTNELTLYNGTLVENNKCMKIYASKHWYNCLVLNFHPVKILAVAVVCTVFLRL